MQHLDASVVRSYYWGVLGLGTGIPRPVGQFTGCPLNAPLVPGILYIDLMNQKELAEKLLEAAEAQAMECYEVGLERLDPDEIAWYEERVTDLNFEMFVDDLAQAAWFAY